MNKSKAFTAKDAKERKGKPNQQVVIFNDFPFASFASSAVKDFIGSKK